MNAAERSAALEVAVAAAREAGAVLRAHWADPLRVRYKGALDMVSQADVAAEETVRRVLGGAFPEDAVLGEEGGQDTAGAARRWIVDPLDGTTNYVHHLPHFAVSIALEAEGAVQVGVVYDPSRDELFEAVAGGGARLDGRPLKASSCADLGDALVATGFPYDRRAHMEAYLAFVEAFLMRCQGLRRAGAAALDLAWIAAGRLDAYWEYKLSPWDVAAGALIVEEAGGRVSGRGGAPFQLESDLIVAAAQAIHPEVVQLLAEVEARVGWGPPAAAGAGAQREGEG